MSAKSRASVCRCTFGALLFFLIAVATAAHAADPAWRPLVHFSPPNHFLNDPNGLVWHDGEYHLFYQHQFKGAPHWGHAVSRDLLHWEHLPTALAPLDERGRCASGTAVFDAQNTSGFFPGRPGLAAVWTYWINTPGEWVKPGQQQQYLATSTDRGRTWTWFDKNPVIPNPGTDDSKHFRDPKVLWHAPTQRWVALVATGDRITLWSSPNLRDWTFASDFGRDQGLHDGIWECPDLFELPLDGDPAKKRWVMLVSSNGPEAGSHTQYFTGDFDGVKFTNANPPDRVLPLDRGTDNYAGITWENVPASDGRRVWIGWMNNWLYCHRVPTKPEGWQGAMTLPRALTLRSTPDGPRLAALPVRELETLREPAQDWTARALAAPAAAPEAYELEAEWDLQNTAPTGELGLRLRVGDDGEETRLGYDLARRELFVDCTRSGRSDFSPRFATRRSAPLSPDADGRLRLRVFVDRCSVEVFAADGLLVFTHLIFPKPTSRGLTAYATRHRSPAQTPHPPPTSLAIH